MYRKWKGAAALGMAALIGCLIPMGTMMAAEDNPEAVQEVEAGSEADAADNDEEILDDNEDVSVEEDADTDENVDDEINADDESAEDEVNADDENAEDEVNADDVIADDEVGPDNDGNDGIAVMSEAEGPEVKDAEETASTAAPVINITLNGESCIYDLGGNIDYKYVNTEPTLKFSASPDGQKINFCYYLDYDPGSTARGVEEVEEVNSSSWTQWTQSEMQYKLSDKNIDYATCVLYVKTKGTDEKIIYARSCGIVVDTVAPNVTGVTNGGTCPEGTTFTVSDANLESVTVNGQTVAPDANGNYQVTAAGTFCEIIAKDKAGNQTVVSNITVTARTPEADGTISANGTYSLAAGTSYKLGAGQWQVSSDKSVYLGGNTFYVGADDNYSFTKR